MHRPKRHVFRDRLVLQQSKSIKMLNKMSAMHKQSGQGVRGKLYLLNDFFEFFKFHHQSSICSSAFTDLFCVGLLIHQFHEFIFAQRHIGQHHRVNVQCRVNGWCFASRFSHFRYFTNRTFVHGAVQLIYAALSLSTF